MWAIIRDCARYAEYMPRLKKSSLVEAGVCHTELQMPFPLTNLWSDCSFELSESPEGHFERTWKLVRGTYKRNSGRWRLIPWGEGRKQTLAVYNLDSDPKMAIPDGIIRAAQTGSLPDVFKAVRKRGVTMRAGGEPAQP